MLRACFVMSLCKYWLRGKKLITQILMMVCFRFSWVITWLLHELGKLSDPLELIKSFQHLWRNVRSVHFSEACLHFRSADMNYTGDASKSKSLPAKRHARPDFEPWNLLLWPHVVNTLRSRKWGQGWGHFLHSLLVRPLAIWGGGKLLTIAAPTWRFLYFSPHT